MISGIAPATITSVLPRRSFVARTVAYGFGAEQSAGKHSFPAKKGQAEKCPSVDLYRVGSDYETKALAAVKTQLAKAGVRLARMLRDGFK